MEIKTTTENLFAKMNKFFLIILFFTVFSNVKTQENESIQNLIYRYASSWGKKRKIGISKIAKLADRNMLKLCLENGDFKVKFFVLEVVSCKKDVNFWFPIVKRMISQEQPENVSLKAIEFASLVDPGSETMIYKIIDSYSWVSEGGLYLLHMSLMKLISKNPENARFSLLRALSHRSRRVKLYSLKFLPMAKLIPSDVKIFIKFTTEINDVEIKEYAIIGLSRFPNIPKVFLLLEKFLKDDESLSARQAALMALGNLEKRAKNFIPDIIFLLETDEEDIRYVAIESLINIDPDSKQVIQALLKACDDKSLSVRQKAIFSLGEIGDITIVAKLKKFLFDHQVKIAVNFAVKKIKNRHELKKK